MVMRADLLHHTRTKGNTFKYLSVFGLALSLAMVLLAGCSGGDDDFDPPPPTFVAQFLSNPEVDGDIAFTPPATFTIASALTTGNILAGIDPVSGDEFRGFLHFPLRGFHGVPSGAVIESATLEIFISSLTIPFPEETLPLLIDLISFQPPEIIAGDFDRLEQPPLLTLPFDLFPSDAGTFVVIDVTALMDQAQIEGLPDFQLRLLLDFIAAEGLVEIEDGAAATAPLLTVEYF